MKGPDMNIQENVHYTNIPVHQDQRDPCLLAIMTAGRDFSPNFLCWVNLSVPVPYCYCKTNKQTNEKTKKNKNLPQTWWCKTTELSYNFRRLKSEMGLDGLKSRCWQDYTSFQMLKGIIICLTLSSF